MQPEDIDRSVDAAKNYINKQMQPADLVAVVSLDTSLSLDQDFTANKAALLHAVGAYNGTEGQGFAPGATSTTNTVEDSTAYTADESEYNDINTDRELFAISTISKSLAYIDEKKSLLYFSGGISRDGIENQASLRNAINAAVRANLSIYSVDTRGLQAISPLGDASTGSLRGTGAFNGAALQNNLDANFNSQEVMSTLSTDTGGKAFFDSNDFAPAFQRVQNDTSAYYVLGFHSTDLRRDGRYRKLQVKLNRNDVKLEYRQGYYAPADFKHSTNEDRERELDEELASDLPATDVAVYLAGALLPRRRDPLLRARLDRRARLADPLHQGRRSRQSHPRHHRRGQRRRRPRHRRRAPDREARHRSVAAGLAQRTSSTPPDSHLPIGKYHLKFVVRENETGKMGSFETDINVPDQRKMPLKLSSVVLASQRVPNSDKKAASPLVRDGVEFVPNLPHVFRQDQHLYLLYEVYDPSHAGATPRRMHPTPKRPKASQRREKRTQRARPRPHQHRIPQRNHQGLRNSARRGQGTQHAAAPRSRLPVRRAARAAQARPLHLPGKRHRRRRRQLHLPPHRHAHPRRATGTASRDSRKSGNRNACAHRKPIASWSGLKQRIIKIG